jgi:hypothetical protein
MDFQDINIVFALNLVKVKGPGVIARISCDNLVIYILSVLGEFEPDLLAVNINLFDFESIALAEIEFFSCLEGVLLIAVKNELGKLVNVGLPE